MAKRKRELSEGDLMRLAGQTKSLVRRRRGAINTNRAACGRLLAAMKPARLVELFKELDIDYVEIIRNIHTLSQEGKSSDGVRLSALRELRDIYVMVAAAHPDLEADVTPDDESADGGDTPFMRYMKEHKKIAVGATP